MDVDINIRHRNTIRVKESLEQQIVFQRIKISDIQRIRNDRTSRRTTPRSENNSLILTPVNKILDNQKVAIVAHFVEHTEFHVEPFDFFRLKKRANFGIFHTFRFIERFAHVSHRHTPVHQLVKILFFTNPTWRWELWDQNLTKLNFNMAAVGDQSSIFHRLRVCRAPPRNNITRVGHMQLKIFQAHALFVAQVRARSHAQQNLVRLLVFMCQVVSVTRHHAWNTKLLAQAIQMLVDADLYIPLMRVFRKPVVLQFKIIPISEYRLVPCSDLFGLFVVIDSQLLAHFTTCATTQDNESFIVFFQELMVDPRFVIHTLKIGDRRELHQVFVSLLVHSKNNQVIPRLVFGWVSVVPTTGGDVGLHTKNWLNACICCGFIEFNRAAHRAMISNCRSLHAHLLDRIHERRNLTQPIEQAMMTMIMQVDIVRRLQA